MYIEPIAKDGVALAVIDTIYGVMVDMDSIDDFEETGAWKPVLSVKYGYVNKDDKFLFPLPSVVSIPIESEIDSLMAYKEFCTEFSFGDGLAKVQGKTSLNYGYINLQGDTVIPAKYLDAQKFNQGRAAVRLDFSEGEKGMGMWGLIDRNGQKVCDFAFDYMRSPVENRTIASIFSLAQHSENDPPFPGFSIKQFLLDENGKIISNIDNGFFRFYPFSEGKAVAVPSELGYALGLGCRFIAKDGEFIKPMDTSNITEEQMQELVDSKGFLNKVFPEDIEFHDAIPFSEGYAAVDIGYGWVFVDTLLIPRGNIEYPQFENALPFSHGLAGVKLNGKFGYIDKDFNVVIPCKYDSCAVAGKSLCRVYDGALTQSGYPIVSYINRKNEVIWQAVDYDKAYSGRKGRDQFGTWTNNIEYNYMGKDLPIVLVVFIVAALVVVISVVVRSITRKGRNDMESSKSVVSVKHLS